MMDTCLFGISAFEALRASDTLPFDLYGLPRTAKRSATGVPRLGEIDAQLKALGVVGRPLHVLLDNDACSRRSSDVVCHVLTKQLPPRSLIRCDSNLLVPTPELCFLQLADSRCANVGSSCLSREIELVLKGFELAGEYRMDAMDPDGFRTIERPATTAERMRQTLALCTRLRGIALARKVLSSVQDNARSPGEAAMALLLTGPRRLGGMGFPRGVLNWPIQTSSGLRKVDLGWPWLRAGLEYKGRKYHPEGRASVDDRRENSITGSGITLLNVWYEDLASPWLFDQLVHDISRVLGLRVRIRDEQFSYRQRVLRSLALPPLRRYDDML
ncbi:hypothetical protein [Enorma phocaeensis]|uniref:Uncharacterized protein n=1 Tax=Enorma phocaeensis TaxID=1871019 RepID=A0ABT7VAZ7_9ACTN|nr:hypothetical protein [Enorma phocaeensis]MDM8275675.1 hypothetical protein [Enorma phocaeensis]